MRRWCSTIEAATQGADAEERAVRQAGGEARGHQHRVGRRHGRADVGHGEGQHEPQEQGLARELGAQGGRTGAPTTTPAAYTRETTWPAVGMVMPTPWATSGSSPMVTNSVVPIANPPVASARSASRGWAAGQAGAPSATSASATAITESVTGLQPGQAARHSPGHSPPRAPLQRGPRPDAATGQPPGVGHHGGGRTGPVAVRRTRPGRRRCRERCLREPRGRAAGR